MPLQIRPLTKADLAALEALIRNAFASSPASRVMRPTDPTPEDIASSVEDYQKFLDDKTATCLFVVDTDLLPPAVAAEGEALARGETVENPVAVPEDAICAFVKFHVYPDGPPADKRKAVTLESLGNLAGRNAEASLAFLSMLSNMHERNMGGRPHTYVHILVANPKHQRRGAGTMLLRHVFVEADKHGLDTWLESTPVGHPLYNRVGFKDVDRADIDWSKYGDTGTYYNMGLLRPTENPKAA